MSTIQPPVQLSADMDKGQQAAFINQNFQTVTTALQATLNNDFFKIVKTGTASLVTPSSMTASQVVTTTIAHNLGSSPAFSVYGVSPAGLGYPNSGQLTNLPILLGGGNGIITLMAQASVDSTNLYIQVLNNYALTISGVGGTWTFRYYLLQESAT